MLVDLDVYEHLKSRSTFEDTFSSVLRRELGFGGDGGEADDPAHDREAGEETPRPPAAPRQIARAVRRAKRAKRSRAAAGTLLPETEYHRPILAILAENGGRLPKQAVIDEVGRRLADRLTDADRERLENGVIRWQSRAQFARLRLAERDLIDRSAPRGIWAITEKGEQALHGAV